MKDPGEKDLSDNTVCSHPFRGRVQCMGGSRCFPFLFTINV